MKVEHRGMNHLFTEIMKIAKPDPISHMSLILMKILPYFNIRVEQLDPQKGSC